MPAIGASTSLSYRDQGSSGAFTAIASEVMVNVPNAEVETVESTHLGSTSRIRTYIAGIVTPGDWSFECNYDKTEFAAMVALRGTVKNFKILLPDGSDFTFDSLVTRVEQQPVNYGELLKFTVTGRVSGAVTFTAAA